MGVEYSWFNDQQMAIRYTASGQWDWKDYHTCVRMSLFLLHQHPHQVDSVIDLRNGTRLPAGLAPHVRTFGKRGHPQLTGRALVIGMPTDALIKLGVDDQRRLITPDGIIQFVQTDSELIATLATWQNDTSLNTKDMAE
ncbi:MAG: hypothetical protein MUF87_07380 [Anaerolineae bacterium]|jgi:hypothetical protein|nr:hypothetical protein [Anaerolineae bacterium]